MKPLVLDDIRGVLHAELRGGNVSGLIEGVSTDSRNIAEGELFVALRGDNFDGHDFVDEAIQRGARAILVDRSMGLSPAMAERGVCLFQVKNTVEALGLLARYYRRSLGKTVTVIAVTGSNGKTTTREMIYHVLSKSRKGCQSYSNYNNHIGVPLTLLNIDADDEFTVVEMGSNAHGEIAELSRIAEPDIAVITHIGTSHLAGLGDINGVSLEKSGIIAGLSDHGIVICTAAHNGTLERLRGIGKAVITFGLDDNADVFASELVYEPGHIRFLTNDRCEVVLDIAGLHNVSNALATLAVVRRMGISSQAFAEAIRDFPGVVRRLTYAFVNGITIIDDSYNANPSSVTAALGELVSNDGLGRRVFICGDMGELGDACDDLHCALGREVAASGIDLFLAVGHKAALAANAAIEAGMGRSRVQRAVTSKRLARLAKSLIHDGDVILVKGSRFMEMEKVIASLQRWRGRPITAINPRATAHKSPGRKKTVKQ